MSAASERLDRPRTRPRHNRPPVAAGWSPSLLDMHFKSGETARVRAAVTAYAAPWAGENTLDDVVLMIHELCTNAIQHGGGSGQLRMWRDARSLFCEVSDSGPGLPEAVSPGAELPPTGSERGRGLWLARRTADLHIETGTSGTTVTATVPLP